MLAAIVAVGVLLRLVPWLRDPAIALRDDAAYHERLVRATVAAGRVPAVDSLSEAPQGRRLAEHLPLGLYAASAAFHRVLAPLDRAPVRTHVIVFIALAGARRRTVHLATRALGAALDRLLAAAIAVCCAHLRGTFGHWCATTSRARCLSRCTRVSGCGTRMGQARRSRGGRPARDPALRARTPPRRSSPDRAACSMPRSPRVPMSCCRVARSLLLPA